MRRKKILNEESHGIDEHNYYIKRKKQCPKCIKGSKIVHESELKC